MVKNGEANGERPEQIKESRWTELGDGKNWGVWQEDPNWTPACKSSFSLGHEHFLQQDRSLFQYEIVPSNLPQIGVVAATFESHGRTRSFRRGAVISNKMHCFLIYAYRKWSHLTLKKNCIFLIDFNFTIHFELMKKEKIKNF